MRGAASLGGPLVPGLSVLAVEVSRLGAMVDQVEQILATLPELTNLSGVWEMLDRRSAAGDAAFLAELGIALDERYGSTADQVRQYRSVFDHLLRLLTITPGQKNIEQALRLVSAAGSGGRRRDRYVASLLASAHPPKDLAVVFAGGGARGDALEELRACLVHEMVLRGVAVTKARRIAPWASSSHWRHHPLGWLPLSPSGMEQAPAMPHYSVRGSSCSLPFGPSEGHDLPLDPAFTARVPAARETTTPSMASAMAVAVANWADESNGRIEARVFDLAEPVDAQVFPDMLAAVGLECLSGLSRRSRFSIFSCPPAQPWRVLFAAASTGGAYNQGCYGAYGRLAAWRSLAGISGAAEGASPAEVERQVQDCDWFRFDADTDWFEQVAWDIGLAAVRPGHQRLAVLAATDTD